MKHLSILGSTGSIGRNALSIVAMHPDKFNITVLAAARNIILLNKQIKKFKPRMVVVLDEVHAHKLESLLEKNQRPEIMFGTKGYINAASYRNSDIVLLAMVGAAGLMPAIAAIKAGKNIALANKETLVMAGDIIISKAKEKNVTIYPVDSEHSAIFQCLQGNKQKDLKKIFLTASGGPFRKKSISEFKNIQLKHALNHPTWDMGPKITIDSATLMNKALEIIEAVHLFNLNPCSIEVLIHPQSIVHSMVGFKDGSIIAQMGIPDMKNAISYAISFPRRLELELEFPDFTSIKELYFEKPDTSKFPSLEFAFEACKQGGTLPAVMNAANEIAVNNFLKQKINFPDIFKIIRKTMELHKNIHNPELSDIIDADIWARQISQSLI